MKRNRSTCQGCDEVLDLADLAPWLLQSTHTLYKRAAAGFSAFPRRLPGRNITVTCISVKSWMKETPR